MTSAARLRDRRFWRYLPPAFAVILLVVGVIAVRPSWRAAHGGGTAGAWTISENLCGRRNCEFRGQFRADDGTDVRTDLVFYDPLPETAKVGDSFRARDTGDRNGVFAQSGSNQWHKPALLVLASALLLLAWGTWLVVMAVRRR